MWERKCEWYFKVDHAVEHTRSQQVDFQLRFNALFWFLTMIHRYRTISAASEIRTRAPAAGTLASFDGDFSIWVGRLTLGVFR